MEIVYFVLGIVTVLLILGVVVIVKVSNSTKELNERIGNVEINIDNVNNDLYRRIDDTETSIHSVIREIEVDLRSQLDSRLDKLTNQIIKQKG